MERLKYWVADIYECAIEVFRTKEEAMEEAWASDPANVHEMVELREGDRILSAEEYRALKIDALRWEHAAKINQSMLDKIRYWNTIRKFPNNEYKVDELEQIIKEGMQHIRDFAKEQGWE